MTKTANLESAPTETELSEIARAVVANALDDTWLMLTFEMTYVDVDVWRHSFTQSDGVVERQFLDSDGLPEVLSDQMHDRIIATGGPSWQGLTVHLMRESVDADADAGFDFSFTYPE